MTCSELSPGLYDLLLDESLRDLLARSPAAIGACKDTP